MVRSPDKCSIVKCFLLLIWNFFFLFIAMWNQLYRRDQARFAKSVFLQRTFLLKQNQKFNNLDRNYYDSCWHTFFLKEFIKHSESVYSVQFSSVAQSCPTLHDPMNPSTPGLPVYHQLPEFTQTHIHRVSDAIQPSHPLSFPSPPAPIPPRIRVFSNESTLRMRWPNYWTFTFSIIPSKEIPGLISFRITCYRFFQNEYCLKKTWN